MDRTPTNNSPEDSPYLKESETDQTFVGKFKSIITNTPLSKWFRKQGDINRSIVRRREDAEDEEERKMQPPSKRVKLPFQGENNICNSVLFDEVSVVPSVSDSDKKYDFNIEPVAGPSGMQSQKLYSCSTNSRRTYESSEILNGDKDSDSEESTSGYSSVPRIGSKEHVCESQPDSKQTSPLQNTSNHKRSLFETSKSSSTSHSLYLERNRSPNLNTSLSSRRPSFNASSFGSPNFVDKTLSTKNIINSPFYNGKTIYGGASAYGRNLGRPANDLRTLLKNPVQIKPINKTNQNGNLVLGKTARRILETLEQYNSPVNDAKKIPTVSKKPQSDGMLNKYIGASPYRIQGSRVSSNKELQVPSVSDLLKMKQKTRLQNSTEMVRQIAVNSKSNLNAESYKLRNKDSEKDKPTGKIKTKVASVRQKPECNDTVAELNLPSISLPITTLPKFDLVIPPPHLAVEKNIQRSVETPTKTSFAPSPIPISSNAQPQRKTVETEKNVQSEKGVSKDIEYKFADPVIIAENIKSIVGINNFKFSQPLYKEKASESFINFKMPENKLPILMSKNKNNGETGIKTAAVLKTGSVLDILGKKEGNLADKFKPASGTWECSTCLIRNPAGKTKCLACETPKSKPAKNDSDTGFSNQFKLSADKWECSVCLVRNSNSDSKCVACTTPKSVLESDSSKKPLNFRNPFKLSSNMWECPICLIQNKNEHTKCVACEAANPKAESCVSSSVFSSKFKSPPGTWECSACLVRNKEDATKCIACETAQTVTKPQVGNFGSSFKLKQNEWECGLCMVRNKSETVKCQCCEAPKPGIDPKNNALNEKSVSSFNFGIDKASATSFSFGIPPNSTKDMPKMDVKPATVFGDSAASAPSTSNFSFGVPSKVKEKEKTETTSSIEVSIPPVTTSSNPLLKPSEKLPQEAKPASAGFKFGLTSPASVAKDVGSHKRGEIITVTPSSKSIELSKPVFNFNKSANVNLFAKKSVVNERRDTPATDKPANIFAFSAKSPAAAPLVSQSTEKKETTGRPAMAPLFKFGSSSQPIFSSNVSSTNNGFDSANTSKFGGSAGVKLPASNMTEVKPFTFESVVANGEEPARKVPMFSFNQPLAKPVAAPASQSTGFNFASANTNPSFNFMAAKTNSLNTNAFGSTTSQIATSPSFNFGSSAATNANTQKAGFSFGSAMTNSSAPQLPGFNFGAVQAPSPGGFNFSPAATPAFDANAKPSFNFTGGNVAMFTAQSPADGVGAAPPQRKIKKAVRRTQR